MAELNEYKCPCCGGGIQFNSTVQKMKCPYCDSEFEMDAVMSYDDDLKNDAPEKYNWARDCSQFSEAEAAGLKTYGCQSCGAEIVGDDTLGSSKCPYCDNPIVMKAQFSGDLKPDYIIPFKLDKKAAKENLKQHLSNKKLLPKIFKDENHIDEIKGIYVPFWLFDTDADARIRYKATRTRHWSDANYMYKETKYYAVVRGGKIGFNTIPVDGSSKMEDELMESIEPFNFSEAVPFQSAYLAGYLADRYDVDSDASIGRANQRVKNSTESEFRKTVMGYDSVVTERSNIWLHNGKIKYALYPVWILNTTWRGKKYRFAMNGQTGKFVGDLPADISVALKYFFTTFLGCGALITAVLRLLNIM